MNNYSNAQDLASYGRGNDTQLVHMTPGEVKGLQALALAHGGSLTINPDTGLPEAGFLERILPMVAGAGLMMIPGVGPLAAAAMVGGGYGLATGSVEKGLMAGLGAYGGAGLVGSLSSLGGQAAAEAAQQTAVEGFKETAAEAAKSSLGEAATANLQSLNPSVTSGEFAREMGTTGFNMPAGGLPSTQSVNAQAAQKFLENPNNFKGLTSETLQGYQGALNAPGANPQDVIAAAGRAQGASGATMSSNVSRGLKEASSSLPAAGQFASSNIGTIGSAALPLLSADQPAGPAGYQEDEYDRRLKGYKLSPNYQAYEAPRPNPYYRPSYAAAGGVMNSYDDEAGVDMASGGIARYRSKGQVNVLQDYLDRQDREEAQKQKHLSTNPSSYFPDVGIFRDTDVDTARKDALTASMIRLGKAGKGAGIKTVPLPKTSIRGLGDVRGATPEIEEAAEGGVMGYNLGGYSDGGRMLEGPGDGMSDSIPASIAGKQPARLADGEFVVPADVVSHLGNGSTDAGAKKLYKMMDKIRMARTGTKEQAPEIKADKYLPVKTAASGGIAGYAEGGVARYNDGGPLATNIQNAYNQGYSGAQIGAALIASGVSPEAAAAATGLSADVIAQVYAGGASLGGNIGDPAGPARNVGTTANTANTVTQRQIRTPQEYLTLLLGLTSAGRPLEAAKQELRNTYGATDADLYAIADLYNSQNRTRTTTTTTNPTTTQPTFTNQQILDAIKASMAQGFSLEESKQGAMSKYGITPAQLYEVAALYEAQQKFNEASSNSIAAYRPSFVPRPLGIANMPASTINPYSDQGLQDLYGQMMGQYARPATSGAMSDAEVRSFAEEFTRNNPGKGAELGQALINKGIPVNQVIAATGLSPGTVNTAYIGGQKLGVAPPPTINTQYNYSDPGIYYRPPAVNNLVLNTPVADAVTAQANQAKADAAAAAAAQAGNSVGGGRAGGLMSIDRKKRAKYKT
jgi:hypothetical protein